MHKFEILISDEAYAKLCKYCVIHEMGISDLINELILDCLEYEHCVWSYR